jgi:hypothetical protein
MNEELVKRLRSLKALLGAGSPEVSGWSTAVRKGSQKVVNDAIAALTAQQSQEPVAWMYQGGDSKPFASMNHPASFDKNELSENEVAVTPLYTAPQPGVREGMLRAAKICRRRADEITHENCVEDMSTGVWEGGSNEVNAQIEILEDIAGAITRAADQINAEAPVPAQRGTGSLLPVATPDASAPQSSQPDTVVWRCFHCGEGFTDDVTAAEHFGSDQSQQSACQIDIAEYRRMEEINRRHCDEDTELHREIHRLHASHQIALRQEEEKGYARGLRDAHPDPSAPKSSRTECHHERTTIHFLGDGSRVEFCPECGRNISLNDNPLPVSSQPDTVAVPRVYVASRTNRAQMWQEFRDEGYPIISSWIDEACEGETADFSELWQRIYKEISDCCGVLFYANPVDAPWKGAFIEVGIALGMGKLVCVVIDGELEGRTMRPVGSWMAHPKVVKHDSLREAFDELLRAAQEGK